MDISIYSVSLTLLFKIHHFYEYLATANFRIFYLDGT